MSICCSLTKPLSKEVHTLPTKFRNRIIPTPPSEVHYSLQSISGKSNIEAAVSKIEFVSTLYPEIIYPWIEINSYIVKKQKSKKQTSIVVLHIKNTSSQIDNNDKTTLLLSHANSCDLGSLYPDLIDMSVQLKMDIITYDYSGFGRSTGKFSKDEMYNDLETVLTEYVIKANIRLENVIL